MTMKMYLLINKQTAYKRVLTLTTHLYAVLVSIRRGTIILHQMNIWASGKFRSLQKYRRGLSAVIHQVRSVVLPFQGLLNFTTLIQNFATKHIVR